MMFNLTKIKKLTRTSLLTLLMAGTLAAQSGTAATAAFKFSDFLFKRASANPTTEFHDKTFYQTQTSTTNNKGKVTVTTTDVKGAAAFQQFVLKESSAIDLNTLNARKLDSTKLKLKYARNINIYFINEGAGYKNQLKLVTTGSTAKNGLVFYDGSKGSGANELVTGDYVTVGDNSSNNDVVKAGTTLDFQLRANGYNNSNPDVWYTDKTKNIDNLQHVIAYEYQGYLVLAWEDLRNGGDKDYNDIVFAVDIGQANLDEIPSEPPANRAPSAEDDTPTTPYNTPVIIDVLANDTDPENQALTITGVNSLTGATVEIVTDAGKQKVKYTPKSDLSGATESFSYTVKDSLGATDSATVTVSVGAQPSCHSNNGHGNNAPVNITLSDGTNISGTYDSSNPGNSATNKLTVRSSSGATISYSNLTAFQKAEFNSKVQDIELRGSGSNGSGCPNVDTDEDTLNDNVDPYPTNPDGDGDTLNDNVDPYPTNPDGDGDALNDNVDPYPTNPDGDGDTLNDNVDPDPTHPLDDETLGENIKPIKPTKPTAD
jgi:hypothetical protein